MTDFDTAANNYVRCNENSYCEIFNSSKDAHNWILDTEGDYIERRYGGLSTNNSNWFVWYNNKGYHSMPVFLNKLNSALFKAELNDSELEIKTSNHPFKLGRAELSTSSLYVKNILFSIPFSLLYNEIFIAGFKILPMLEFRLYF